jgi:hypothetical protein
MRRAIRFRLGIPAVLGCLLLAVPGPSGAQRLALFEEGFEADSLVCWDLMATGAQIGLDGTIVYSGNQSLRIQGDAAQGHGARAKSRMLYTDFTKPYMVQFAFRYQDFHWDRFLVFGHIRLLLDYPWLPILYDPVGDNSFPGHPVSSESFDTFVEAGQWVWINVYCDPSVNTYWVYIDGTLVGSVVYQNSVVPDPRFWFEDNYSDTNFLDAWYDDITIWGFQTRVPFCNPGAAFDPTDCSAWVQPPAVPFHGQYNIPDVPQPLAEACAPPAPNGRCMLACLEMVFDAHGDNLPLPGGNYAGPQEEMEAAANTNDRVNCPNGQWSGTSQSDLRRAGHFSSVGQALTATRQGCPPQGCPGAPGAFGYSWRDLGYAVVDSVWTDLAPVDTVFVEDPEARPWLLEALLASGYPIIALIDPPPDYCDSIAVEYGEGEIVDCDQAIIETPGHACVLIGFDNVGGQGGNPWGVPAFLIHDPALVRSGWIPMAFFWNQVWAGKRFVFAAPWEGFWMSPARWCYNAKMDATLLAIYPGPDPLGGFYAVNNPTATLNLVNAGFQGGEVATHQLPGIATTGTYDFTTWKLQGPGIVQGQNLIAWVTWTAKGRLAGASSTSYANYNDDLGGTGSSMHPVNLCLSLQPKDPGHFGWPYGGHWWHRGPGGSGLRVSLLSESEAEIYVTVGNFGEEPIPSGTMCLLSWKDPTTAERAPGGVPIADFELPPLSPGDTLTLGPIPWTLPSANGFGEPAFTIFSEIVCAEDPPESPWPQDENDYATLADFRLETTQGTPASLSFWLENPEDVPRDVVLYVEPEEGWQGEAVTDPPAGQLVSLGPLEMQPATVTVTPAAGDTFGIVHVGAYLYDPDTGDLLRETGGLSLLVESPGVSGVDQPSVRDILRLDPIRPQPVTDRGVLRFVLGRASRVRLEIFDVSGRLVTRLLDARRPAGVTEVVWDARNASGSRVATGVYWARLRADGLGSRTRRVVVVR